MKQFIKLVSVSILGGVITLGSYKVMIDEDETGLEHSFTEQKSSSFIPTSSTSNIYGTNADFTEAAEKTVHSVVHVKNVAVFNKPNSIWEYYSQSGSPGKAIQGAGSGVIISPDGYIITNNHVIKGAGEIEVTLNNNKTYVASVVGVDAKADIALIKINAVELEYIPFGNSNDIKLGEWVLAVGNPFNLTSTVTAGIVSAKARDLDAYDGTPQSFIQTDAAINPGNSGGALVNIEGELIGINTAITSQTGSFVGYGFAVPSNNARKIVEDIMEYGNVQQGVLGIRGLDVNQNISKQLDLTTSQGVMVGGVDSGSGAALAGIKQGDVIRRVDNIEIRKMADLTGYLGSKRPEDVVLLRIIRDGKEKDVTVKLAKYETYAIPKIGLEVTNATAAELRAYNSKNGVKISGALNGDQQSQALIGIVITKINNQPVNNIDEVKSLLQNKSSAEPVSVTFVNKEGKELTYIWR